MYWVTNDQGVKEDAPRELSADDIQQLLSHGWKIERVAPPKDDSVSFNATIRSLGNPLDTATLESVIRRITAASPSHWSRDTVVIAPTFSSLPADVVAKAKREGYDAQGRKANGETVSGVTYDGKVYVVQENVSSELEAEETLLHERLHQIVHGNPKDPEGIELRQQLGRLYTKLGARTGIERMAKDLGIKIDGPISALKTVAPRNQPAFLAEEFLAHAEGARAYEKLPERVARAIREFYGQFRDWLRGSKFARIAEAMGVQLGDFTKSDLAWTLKGIRQQEAGAGSKAIRFMTAYHGSKALWKSVSETPSILESRSSNTQSTYEQRIDALWNGTAPEFHGVRVLDRSDVLDLLGFGNQPVFLQESKVAKGKLEHNLTAEHWKKVPQWLENPAMVLDSDTVTGRLVFLAPEQLNGAPIVIAVEPSADKGGLTVNLLVNAYDKDSGRMPLRRWINEGLLRYYDKRTSPAILARSGLQLSSLAQARGRNWKIRRDADLVKYRAENPAQESRGSTLNTGTTPDQVRSAFVKAFGGKTVRQMEENGLIHIVATADDLPYGLTVSSSGKAFWHEGTGKAYFIADRMSSSLAHRELLHEIGEHAGLETMLGEKGYNALIAKVKELRNAGDKDVVKAWNMVLASYVNDPKLKPNERLVEGGRAFMHEVLAKVGEVADIQKQSWWRDIINAVKAWLIRGQRFGFTGMIKVADIQDMVMHSLKVAAKVKPGPKGGISDEYGNAQLGLILASMASGNRKPTAAEIAEAQRQYDEVRARYMNTPQWMKAPNGERSKLNERLWVMTRTPLFKQWFGDWEAAERQSRWQGLIDRALSDRTWQKRTMLAAGPEADPSGKLSDTFGFKVVTQYLTPDDLRKTNNRHGQGNEKDKDQIGLSGDDYVKALEVLRDPETFKNTVSSNGKPSAEFGREFSDGTYVVVDVEVAERGAVSIKSAWKRVPGRNHAGASAYPIRTSSLAAGSGQSIHSDALLVKDGDVSKVVDGNGEPLVVYHGSETAGFTVFDDGKSGAIFTSDDSYVASSYSDNVSDEVTLSAQEILDGMSEGDFDSHEDTYVSGYYIDGNFYETLKDAENDGWEFDDNGESDRGIQIHSWDDDYGYSIDFTGTLSDALAHLEDRGEHRPGVYSLFINARSLAEIDWDGMGWDDGPDGMNTNEAVATLTGGDAVLIRDVVDTGSAGGGRGASNVYAVFDKRNVKSATGNVGTFDGTNPDIRYSNRGQWYYSALANTIPAMSKIADKNGMMSPVQAKAWLLARQKEGKFKLEEMEWVGVLDFIGMQDGKPSMIAQAAKKLGAEVGEVSFDVTDDQAYRAKAAQMYGEREVDNLSPAQVALVMKRISKTDMRQPAFPITDKMREQVANGMPLFSRGG